MPRSYQHISDFKNENIRIKIKRIDFEKNRRKT